MFGIGMPEMVIIFVIALVILGPKKLPDLARALGKGMAEFRKATDEIKANLDVKDELNEMGEGLADSVSGLIDSYDIEEQTETETDTTVATENDEEKGDIAEKKTDG